MATNWLYGVSVSLLHNRCQWMAVAFDSLEEGFGGSEIEEEVEADGQVVLVVGDVEGDDFLLAPFLVVFHEGEDKATIDGFIIVFGFELFLSSVDECLFLYFASGGHLEMDFVSYLIIFRVERAGALQDAEHVVDALVHGLLCGADASVLVQASLVGLALSARVAEPCFIHGVSLSLFGSLAEVERLHLGGHAADEGVAHLEEVVCPSAAGGDE